MSYTMQKGRRNCPEMSGGLCSGGIYPEEMSGFPTTQPLNLLTPPCSLYVSAPDHLLQKVCNILDSCTPMTCNLAGNTEEKQIKCGFHSYLAYVWNCML